MSSRVLTLGLLALFGCTTSPPSLVLLRIDAEPGVQALSRSYTVRIEGRAPGGEFTEEFMESYQDGWGRDLTIGPREHDASRSYRITLTAFEDANATGDGFVRNVLISGYVQGQTRRYDLILYDSCQGVECGVNELCDRAGTCQPAEIPSTDLPVLDAGSAEDSALPDVLGGLDTGVDAGLPDSALPDGGTLLDGGTLSDATSSPDSSLPVDAGPLADSAVSGDAMVITDAGPMDSGFMDASVGMDAGGFMDASVGMDTGPADLDAGGFMDASVGMETGPVDLDAGGISVDAAAP